MPFDFDELFLLFFFVAITLLLAFDAPYPSKQWRIANERHINRLRQVGRILFALDALDRRKPQERTRSFSRRRNWNWLALNNWIRRLLLNRRRSSSRGSYWGNYLDNACQPTEPEGTIAGTGDPPCSFSGKRIYKTTPARHVR